MEKEANEVMYKMAELMLKKMQENGLINEEECRKIRQLNMETFSPGVDGLGILKGKIMRIPKHADMKIPHMGWNSLHLQNNGRLFENIDEGAYVYFVHSYYLKAEDESIVKATTEYGTTIHASVESDNVFACQFHPEKSSSIGLGILENFTKVK